MPSNALYFPHINVPSNAWTTQAILYWDRLASIVPLDFMENPGQADELTRRLMVEGLVQPVFPAALTYQVERFDECFIEYVERKVIPFRRHLGSMQRKGAVSLVHAEKLGRIPDFLVDAGLAKQVNASWYQMDTPLANRFMAYLATVLSALPHIDATPITDMALMADTFGMRGRAEAMRARGMHAAKARSSLLKAMLPVPDGPLDVDKLLAFKCRYGELLPKFRERIERHCASVALLSEPEARIQATKEFVDDCEGEIAEITAAMTPAFGKVVLGSLIPLFGSGLAWHATDAGNKIAYAGSAMSFAGAAYQAIASIRDLRLQHERRPLAYVSHARRVLGIR